MKYIIVDGLDLHAQLLLEPLDVQEILSQNRGGGLRSKYILNLHVYLLKGNVKNKQRMGKGTNNKNTKVCFYSSFQETFKGRAIHKLTLLAGLRRTCRELPLYPGLVRRVQVRVGLISTGVVGVGVGFSVKFVKKKTFVLGEVLLRITKLIR